MTQKSYFAIHFECHTCLNTSSKAMCAMGHTMISNSSLISKAEENTKSVSKYSQPKVLCVMCLSMVSKKTSKGRGLT